MTSFTIYLLSTGQIVRVGAVRPQDLPLQVLPGEGILIGVQGSFLTQKIDITTNPPVLVSQ
jgi:hypothetical protein